MRSTLLARLQRLEAKTEADTSVMFQYGWLRRLPGEFTGEKHTVIVKREPSRRSNVEWCEFEERTGTAESFGLNRPSAS